MAHYPTIAGLDTNTIKRIVASALEEDIGSGDITSQLTLDPKTQATLKFVARQELVVCGGFIPQFIYDDAEQFIGEGKIAKPGDVIAIAKGAAQALLTGERVALNLMQRMSGVATLTQHYVDAVAGTKAIILDTRKTMPGLRIFDKYAVRTGGGQNHRMRLDDMILIKDNHIAACGGIAQAVQKLRGSTLPLVIECDTLAQVEEAIAAGPDRILLDNMSLDELRSAVKLSAGKTPLEASGNVSLATVQAIAQTGVDYISVGKITHSAPAVDIGADIEMTA